MHPEATGLTLWDGEVGGSKGRGVELVARGLSSAGAPQSLYTVTASERAGGGLRGQSPWLPLLMGEWSSFSLQKSVGVVCRLLLSVVLRPFGTLSLFSLCT